jgi:signal transduction histidine kinase
MQSRLRIFSERMIYAIREPLLMIDSKMQVHVTNPAFCTCFELSSEAILGRTLQELEHGPWNTADVLEKLHEVFTFNRDLENYEVAALMGSLPLKTFSINARRLDSLNKNSALGSGLVLLAVEDISEKVRSAKIEKEKIQAEIANQTKSSFLANLSHEIRTPLSSIIGFAELLSREIAVDSTKFTYIEIILNNARHLLDLVGEVLDLSKIEARKFEVFTTEVCLLHEIGLVFDILRAKAKEKNLRLELICFPSTPKIISTDPTRFRQILINLIGNAVKFTQEGGVKLKVDMVESGLLRLSVIDTGNGIPVNMQESIFDQFTQAKMPASQCSEGTGLGLTLSRELARLLGGDIVLVSSEKDKGSHFDIFIQPGMSRKLSEKDHKDPAPLPSPWKAGRQNLEGIRVLLAEDGPDIQALYEHLLRYEGADVTVVENGELAIQAALKESFDVILMDHRMPILDGLEATSRLRAQGYTAPILALTANATREEREASLAAGCNDFMCKPIDSVTLCQTVSQWSFEKQAPRGK